MKVAILGKIIKSEPTEYITKIISLLEKRGVSVFLEFEYFNVLNGAISGSVKSFKELDKSFDLLISIGGDGTILKAITFVKNLSIPIVGINSGRLGFLATIQVDSIEETQQCENSGGLGLFGDGLRTAKTYQASEDKLTISTNDNGYLSFSTQ